MQKEKRQIFLYDDAEFEEQLLCNLKLQLKDSGITDFAKFSLTPVNAKKYSVRQWGLLFLILSEYSDLQGQKS